MAKSELPSTSVSTCVIVPGFTSMLLRANIGVVALKEAEVLPVLVLQGIELMAWLGLASALRVHGQAKHVLSHWDSILRHCAAPGFG